MSHITYAALRGVFWRGKDGSPAPAILKSLPAGAKFRIEPEPDNQYDPHALKVMVAPDQIPPSQHTELDLVAAGHGFSVEEILAKPEWFIGYIAKEVAAITKPETIVGATLAFDSAGKPQVRLEITT